MQFVWSSSVLITLYYCMRYGEITSHMAERKTNTVVYSLVEHDHVCITLKMRKSCLTFDINMNVRYIGKSSLGRQRLIFQSPLTYKGQIENGAQLECTKGEL